MIEAYKPGIDVTLLDENLRLTPEQRLRRLRQLWRFAQELRRAGVPTDAGRQPIAGTITSGSDRATSLPFQTTYTAG